MKLGSQSTHGGIFGFDKAPRGFKWLITTKYVAITTKYVTITHMWRRFISGRVRRIIFLSDLLALEKHKTNIQTIYPD